MEEWKLTKIGSICRRICSGGTPKSTVDEYYGGGIPWLNTKEVNFNRIYSTESTITEAGLKNSSAKWIDKNAVIVAMYGATAAKCAIGMIPMTTNQACCNLMIDETKADYRFVYYSIVNSFSVLAGLANGGAQQNLNAQLIKDFEIALPSLEAQRRIADILSTIDDKIENNSRINHNLEEQAKALYKSWFIDFEPFKDGKFIDSDLGLIPEGWVVQTLGRIVENRKKSINPQRFPDTVFTHYSLPAFDNSKEPEVQCGSEIMSNKFVVENKMVLFSKLNPRIKRLWVLGDVPENSICSTEFIAYKAHEESMHPFVWCYLNSDSFYDSILSMVNGATGSHQRFHADDTMSFTLPFNQDVALRFSKLIAPLLYSILKNEAENRSLKCERDFLLPRMMSGTLHIGD